MPRTHDERMAKLRAWVAAYDPVAMDRWTRRVSRIALITAMGSTALVIAAQFASPPLAAFTAQAMFGLLLMVVYGQWCVATTRLDMEELQRLLAQLDEEEAAPVADHEA